MVKCLFYVIIIFWRPILFIDVGSPVDELVKLGQFNTDKLMEVTWNNPFVCKKKSKKSLFLCCFEEWMLLSLPCIEEGNSWIECFDDTVC